jgi:hypothetical protein
MSESVLGDPDVSVSLIPALLASDVAPVAVAEPDGGEDDRSDDDPYFYHTDASCLAGRVLRNVET